VGWAALGCGSSGSKEGNPPPPPPAELEEGKVAIAADSSRLQHRNERGVVTLEIDSASSVTHLDKESAEELRSELVQVSGRIYRGGIVASRFRAPKGTFDRQAKTLELREGVTVTSEERGLVLTARRIVWTESVNLIRAEGGVRIKGSLFESGPSNLLVATSDLRRFGTPDRFKK
jgi:hypothetical protein